MKSHALSGVDLVLLVFIAANASCDFFGTIALKVEIPDEFWIVELSALRIQIRDPSPN